MHRCRIKNLFFEETPSPVDFPNRKFQQGALTVMAKSGEIGGEVIVRNLPLKNVAKLSFLLNPDCNGKDWKALAGELGFNLEEVRNLECKSDPTLELIKVHDLKNVKKPLTLEILVQHLNTIRRKDAVQDILDNILIVKKGDHGTENIYENLQAHQSSTTQSKDYTFSNYYDVFISYAREDIEFAKTIVYQLEKKPYFFKVCIDIRDFLPGFNNIEQVAEVIETRCKKVVIIMSEQFNASEECDYQAKVALSLSPGARRHKVIPILYQTCKLPNFLKNLTFLNYTDPIQQEFFWDRLTKAVTIG